MSMLTKPSVYLTSTGIAGTQSSSSHTVSAATSSTTSGPTYMPSLACILFMTSLHVVFFSKCRALVTGRLLPSAARLIAPVISHAGGGAPSLSRWASRCKRMRSASTSRRS